MLRCCVCEGIVREEPPGVFVCVACDDVGFVFEDAYRDEDTGVLWGIVVTPLPARAA